ncbi:MAG: tautomerase family protein [Spongiibacter marinus]|uniref:tautomerase family protein n=1 Tax=Spongiibacter TaxID=630749 RepID=UPI000C093920|nr:hypothetical protein [Spongiibacter sp.]MAK45018.1 4-oxalocrotonate tautomerase [Spongiibacter sp.]|tara:strand:- start:645 stop:1037 length:393 start_codon:yes stop_codon:yes gene_type:complete
MPVYNVATRRPLSYETRKKTADAITDIHCAMTGAPAEFVNVIFMEGHRIKGGHDVGVVCNVRSGGNRNAELTEDLRLRIRDGIAEATQLSTEKVLATLLGFPASWAMEGGEILPEPGEEQAWLERSQSAI